MIDKSMKVSVKKKGKPGRKLRRAMDACRAVKDEYEIDLIRKANAVSTEAHTNVLKQLHRLKTEPEVEASRKSPATSA